MSVPLSLGYSPCPNDTFIFNALVHGLVPSPCRLNERLEDVETLNRLVLAGELDVSKVSFHLFGHVRDRYCLLRSGGALGRGCGPLLVAAQPLTIDELRDRPIAVPGEFTTACLLLRLCAPGLSRLLFMPFNEIMPSVARGDVAAGVIIHESRFTYQGLGLVKLLDLGEWWEGETGEPIPLGGSLPGAPLAVILLLPWTVLWQQVRPMPRPTRKLRLRMSGPMHRRRAKRSVLPISASMSTGLPWIWATTGYGPWKFSLAAQVRPASCPLHLKTSFGIERYGQHTSGY